MVGDLSAIGAEEDGVDLGGQALEEMAGGVCGHPGHRLVVLISEHELVPVMRLHCIAGHGKLGAAWLLRLGSQAVGLGVVELKQPQGTGQVWCIHLLGAAWPLALHHSGSHGTKHFTARESEIRI